MNGMNADAVSADGVTKRIIGCAFTVANTLGVGFLEKVYENALAHEMREQGLRAVQQRAIVVRHDDIVIGEYTADLMVEDHVIVELKVVRSLNDLHIAQCMNYLCASDKRLCLSINFGRPRIEIRRVTAHA
jgi:GxxExxY protein